MYPPPSKFSLFKILFVFVAVLAITGLGAAGYFYYQYDQAQKLKSPDAAKLAAEKEVKDLVAQVGKLVILPKDETPTVATVSDVNQLKEQPFFKTAENGDKVLIYTKAQKAYLYSPKLKKVKDIGPVNLGSEEAAPPAKVAIRNGTSINGLAARVEEDILQEFPGTVIAAREQAGRMTYEETLVIVINEEAKLAAETLAKYLNSTVSPLPAGETAPEGADILVILGRDLDQANAVPTSPAPVRRFSPSPTPTQ